MAVPCLQLRLPCLSPCHIYFSGPLFCQIWLCNAFNGVSRALIFFQGLYFVNYGCAVPSIVSALPFTMLYLFFWACILPHLDVPCLQCGLPRLLPCLSVCLAFLFGIIFFWAFILPDMSVLCLQLALPCLLPSHNIFILQNMAVPCLQLALACLSLCLDFFSGPLFCQI